MFADKMTLDNYERYLSYCPDNSFLRCGIKCEK